MWGPVRVAASPRTRPPPARAQCWLWVEQGVPGADLPEAGHHLLKDHCPQTLITAPQAIIQGPEEPGRCPAPRQTATLGPWWRTAAPAPAQGRLLGQVLRTSISPHRFCPGPGAAAGASPCTPNPPALLTAACRAWHTPGQGSRRRADPTPEQSPNQSVEVHQVWAPGPHQIPCWPSGNM